MHRVFDLAIIDVGHASLPCIAVANIDYHCLSLPPSDIRVPYLAYGITDRIQLNKFVDHLAWDLMRSRP